MHAIKDLMASSTNLFDNTVRQVRKTAKDLPRVSVLDVIELATDLETKQCQQRLGMP